MQLGMKIKERNQPSNAKQARETQEGLMMIVAFQAQRKGLGLGFDFVFW